MVLQPSRCRDPQEKPISEHIVIPVPPIIERTRLETAQKLLKARNLSVTPPRIPAGKGVPVPGVHDFERKWRPQGDSNPCYRRERAMS
jgi:hypothetical protein